MKAMRDAVIVGYGRSPIGKAKKGTLAQVYPTQFAAATLRGVLEKVPQLKWDMIDDVIVGCAKQELMQGKNMGRVICQIAGLPNSVPAQTLNRFCSSGLQSVSVGANAIMTGQADVVIAGGVESMSMLPMNADDPRTYDPELKITNPSVYTPMGITAENVARKYHLSRVELDSFSLQSQKKAAQARETGKFRREIIPLNVKDIDGNIRFMDEDEYIRPTTTMEKLAALSPAFLENGCVTAGNSSGTSDGAAFVVIMSDKKAHELGIKPIAKFLGYAVGGVDPRYMGLGPTVAVPKLLEYLNMDITQFDAIELNEAFASQAIACIRDLNLPEERVNPRGGAIAMGHPLGATGAILLCKALSYLTDIKGRFALVTMCIGGGMGAAGAIEMV